MPALIDLLGQKFGRLTVISRSENDKRGRPKWLCVCECGNSSILLSIAFKSGNTRSCGCLRKELVSKKFTTHGMRQSLEWRSWSSMKQRCLNTKNPNYKDYGARGIKVCESWLTFDGFIADMGRKPYISYTLERLDNNKDYQPDNCIWASRTVQSRNRRLSKNNKSGYNGIYKRKNGTWRAYIAAHGKTIHLGTFNALNDALLARAAGETKYWSNV